MRSPAFAVSQVILISAVWYFYNNVAHSIYAAHSIDRAPQDKSFVRFGSANNKMVYHINHRHYICYFDGIKFSVIT